MPLPFRRNPKSTGTAGRMVAYLLLAFLLAGTFASTSSAQDSGQTITLGESLDDPQRAELLDIFGSTEGDLIIIITVEDTAKAMEGISLAGEISTAYSSSALK